MTFPHLNYQRASPFRIHNPEVLATKKTYSLTAKLTVMTYNLVEIGEDTYLFSFKNIKKPNKDLPSPGLQSDIF